MSLLTIVQDAATRLGLASPSTVITSTDPQIIQLLALAQEEGIALMRRHPWSVLITEKTFTSVATAAQTSEFDDEFDRFVDETFYNRTKKRPVYGPISPQDWQFTQAMVASTLVESFRKRGSDILITPTPSAGWTYAYEYVSNQFCSGASNQDSWQADTDTARISSELTTQGIVWRFLRAKGFDYSEAFRTYEMSVADKFARDGGKRRLNFGQRSAYGMARMPFIQEGSWNL